MKSSVSASGVRNEAEPPRCAARAWAWDMAGSGCNRVSYTAAGVQCGGGGVRLGMAVVVELLRDNARGG
jgi:hypothetical protein